MSEHFISVVVPSHNRENDLSRALESLMVQTYPREQYEIVVVDDSTPAVRIKKSPTIKLIHIPPTSHTKARNLGIKESRGDIVAFTDDDCIPDKDWLKRISEAFQDPDVMGVEGRTLAEKMGINFHAAENTTGQKYPTCNIAFRKSVLTNVGGFDEKYGFFREDTDLAFAILSKNNKIVFKNNVIVNHPPRRTTSLAPLKELKMIKSDIRLYKKFPHLYRKTIGFVGGGGIRISMLVWLFSILAILNVPVNLIVSGILLLTVILIKYFTHIKNRIFSMTDAVSYIIISWVRDLLYLFFFGFYYITEKGK